MATDFCRNKILSQDTVKWPAKSLLSKLNFFIIPQNEKSIEFNEQIYFITAACAVAAVGIIKLIRFTIVREKLLNLAITFNSPDTVYYHWYAMMEVYTNDSTSVQ